jgi:hypothetical protein
LDDKIIGFDIVTNWKRGGGNIIGPWIHLKEIGAENYTVKIMLLQNSPKLLNKQANSVLKIAS